jgi:hypothetical protein
MNANQAREQTQAAVDAMMADYGKTRNWVDGEIGMQARFAGRGITIDLSDIPGGRSDAVMERLMADLRTDGFLVQVGATYDDGEGSTTALHIGW